MDDRPATRRLAFAVIVIVLAALGAYLLGPATHRGGTAAGETKSGARSRPPASPAARAVSLASGRPDIYQWLPFTQAGLAAAAATVVRFGDSYGSYSYTQDAADYAAPMRTFTSAQLIGQIEAAFAAPGVAATRQGEKQIAVGTATIDSIRTFGPGSLTFAVQVAQQFTGLVGRTDQITDYAVTVTGAGTTWQVTDVELAAAGNS
jgi:hypothetical protein